MRSLKYSLQIIIVSLIIGGCSLQTTVPPTSKYMLGVEVEVEKVTNSRFNNQVIRIGQMESPSILSSRSIYYRTEDGRGYSYNKARWLESVPKQLTNLIMISLTKTEIFKDVIPYRSLAKNDLILETSLYAFSQTIHEDGTSTLLVSMKARLVEQYSRNVVSTTLIELKKEGVEGTVKGAIDGYILLSKDLVRAVNKWLEKSCTQESASS